MILNYINLSHPIVYSKIKPALFLIRPVQLYYLFKTALREPVQHPQSNAFITLRAIGCMFIIQQRSVYRCTN
ncbi:hypothetical protein ABID99_005353 [Mucilaginibacter sp. OAE612]